MHVSQFDFRGSGLVGLYVLATEKVVLVGHEVSENDYNKLEEIFQAPVIAMSVAGTGLLGVFMATNGEKILVPSIIFDHEEEILKKNGIDYQKVNTELTCLGNNIIANENGALVNPEFGKKIVDQITDFFETPTRAFSINNAPTVGSFLVHNGKKGLVSPDISDDEAREIEEFLGIELTAGTVEMGASQVRSGIAANSHGYIIGRHSGGPELVNADRAFGFSE